MLTVFIGNYFIIIVLKETIYALSLVYPHVDDGWTIKRSLVVQHCLLFWYLVPRMGQLGLL